MSDRFFKKNALLVELILNVTSGVNIGKKWRKTFLESLIIYLAVFLLSRVFLAAAILAVAQEVPITVVLIKTTIAVIAAKLSLMIKWYQW